MSTTQITAAEAAALLSARALPETRIHPSARNTQDHTFTFMGAFRIEATISTDDGVSALITAYAVGVRLFQYTVDQANPTMRAAGSIAGFKLAMEADLVSDPSRLVFEGEGCVPIEGCQQLHHVLPVD
ncbi:hypothetical protein [Actinokineospora globicatena]|uniref:Uncharacterized protein n=1 Tax=Actinokineospora globicatena TaxID=103729 RepID=A0A9W6QII6_9PSEU|nr:hypothetical protein [Actinokineospora globicatena]MCP2304161.1 hypothetical protein [Actinokineospora globicatena]GLW78482.1 hypothetical protein Aglo01_29640 [Actinokineospora globicatena]GLW84854.1 hypothetical protein Aglo02_24940 [Actinokineospora globicatena]GLW91088.1 hypothetical protein Aglo03_19040 [Actinokineospora globicatena]